MAVMHATKGGAPPSPARLWASMARGDSAFDGVFFVAVASTGVYCRPSCPARRPKPENVRFFSSPDEAEAAGFRPCRRCHPRLAQASPVPALVARACALLDDEGEEAPAAPRLAARLGVPAERLQRAFRQVLGVTPRQYFEARRLERLKGGLRRGRAVTDAMYEAGYGASSRLYESAGVKLGMTPGAYRRGGRGMLIRYCLSGSPLGRLLVAATERGVCSVRLGDTDEALEAALRSEFPEAVIEPDDGALGGWVGQILEYLDGVRRRFDVPLDIQGTAFQLRVWRALQEIGYGATRTYGEVARMVGRPGAARAVGRACATNPVPILIPCHRVVASSGGLGGYGLGLARKRRLLERERTTAAQQPAPAASRRAARPS